LGCDLKPEQRQSLLAAYRHLPAFPDAAAAVADLGEAGYALYAFSNGSAQTVGGLLEGAGILQCFRDVISVEAVRSFKPDPAVYRHFLQRAGVTADRAALVSGNAFDVIGAMNAGLAGFWVRRSNSVRFDPWGIEPDLTVGSLAELKARLAESSA
jgi:2-haloacid dehalogenase